MKIGNTFRAIRLELNLRQTDVAARAGVSQQAVSDLECGRFGGLSLDTYCRIAEVLDADVPLSPRWRGPKLDRILDRRHAELQNRVVKLVAGLGWVVRTEFSFNHYGDRGSVDVLGWRPEARALLLAEMKTEITSLEETLRVMDMKHRVVPPLARGQLGWDSISVASVLVMPASSTHRALLEHHAAAVSASLPSGTWDVRHWLARPTGEMRGVWFLQNTSQGGAKSKLPPLRRVRPKAAAEISVSPRS